MQRHLAANGLRIATGTIVDATIINEPSSTKNTDKARDPEMHQTKKANQWYLRDEGAFRVDNRTKLIKRPSQNAGLLTGDRGFESVSLQRGVWWLPAITAGRGAGASTQ